jgi:hypothetical protein
LRLARRGLGLHEATWRASKELFMINPGVETTSVSIFQWLKPSGAGGTCQEVCDTSEMTLAVAGVANACLSDKCVFYWI